MNSHAVIIGGGIAGLLAAHALANRFERVTILERFRYSPDSVFPSPPARRGVPQSRCPHLLMAAGAAAFDQLTPGWREELVMAGAVPFDACSDALLRFPAGWLPRTASGITTYACSRALLESVLRGRLARKPTVHVREETKVVGLLTGPLGERVVGVHMAERHVSAETSLLADLIVDASGEHSALPGWLARLPTGLPSQLQKTVVESGTRYVSRWFHIEPGDAHEWHCLSMAPSAGAALRSAMMLRAEQDCWGVVLLCPDDEPLPSDDSAFLDFVADLGEGQLRRALAHARPLSRIHNYGPTFNRMMHYERLTAWPDGLVALGDSVCTLDPYFGLGMTAAARGAVFLATLLGEKKSGRVPGFEFQKELASLNAQAWGLATGRDLDGRPLARDERHLSRLYEAAPSSPEVAHALLAVQHLLRPPEMLMEVAV
jgi:2-polyprenyl-6-methoxyphenol hydroxylase-like FAD-dependent oxidoreductase